MLSINMFVARRKLVWILSVLSVFVIVMTVNHYFYLDDTSTNGNGNINNGVSRGSAGNISPDEMQREIQLEMMRKASRFSKRKRIDGAPGDDGSTSTANEDTDEEKEQEVEPVQV